MRTNFQEVSSYCSWKKVYISRAPGLNSNGLEKRLLKEVKYNMNMVIWGMFILFVLTDHVYSKNGVTVLK